MIPFRDTLPILQVFFLNFPKWCKKVSGGSPIPLHRLDCVIWSLDVQQAQYGTKSYKLQWMQKKSFSY